MGIIVKFIIRNIYEKKFRTFLILFSILISSALFFASGAMSDTMVKIFTDRIRNYYGSADIIIHPQEKSPAPFFSTNGAKAIEGDAEYIIGAIQGSGGYTYKKDEMVNFTLMGTDLDQLGTMNPFILEQQSGLYPFEGKKMVVSKNTADKYGLKLGDTIELDIGGSKYRFSLKGITQPAGLFFDDGSSTYAVVPMQTLASIYNARGRVNIAYIKLRDPSQKSRVITDLSKIYDRYAVREPFSEEEMMENTRGMSTSYTLMAFIVSIMSVFIIYTSFKVVTMERLPVIGTFRSIGATRRMTNFVLMAESIIYGTVGGLLGCGAGIGILHIMAVATTPVWAKGFKTAVEYNPVQLVMAFLFALILSFISCIIPIIKVARIPVKDIVLNSIEKVKGKKRWKLVLGIVFLIAAFAVPPLTPRNLVLFVNSACMLMSVFAVILLVPYMTNAFIKVFEKVYIYIFGNIGSLAAKNLRENRNILNNISLLAIGISSLIMINTISFSSVTELVKFYRGATFDIWIMHMPQANRNLERSLLQVEGVTGVYGVYRLNGVEISDHRPQRISAIHGVDKTKFADYWKLDFQGDQQTLLEELDSGRNIIISTILKEKFSLEKGDNITLRIKDSDKTYRVIGFVNTLMNNGSFALISERYLKSDAGMKYYSNIHVKTDRDPDEVEKMIQKQFARRRPFMRTVKQMEALNQQSNEGIFVTLKGFSILALIIGIFGVLNNLVISFIERKRSIAMLRSIGMSKKQVVRMIFIEAFTGGLIGGIAGLFTGFLLVWGVPYVMKSLDMTLPLHYPVESMYGYLLAAVIIVVTASISPAAKSSRLNIIEAVKYE